MNIKDDTTKTNAISQQSVFALIASLTGQGNILALPKLFVAMFRGDAATALVFTQLLYWSDKGKRRDGAIYKSCRELAEETGLTPRQVERAVSVIKGKKLARVEVKRANGAPTSHFYLDAGAIADSILEQAKSESDDVVDRESASDTPISLNGEIHSTKRVNPFTQTGKSIYANGEILNKDYSRDYAQTTAGEAFPAAALAETGFPPSHSGNESMNSETIDASELNELIDVLAEVCVMDFNLNRGRLAKRAKQLLQAGYDSADVWEHYSNDTVEDRLDGLDGDEWHWYLADWRGSDREQIPTPEQILETIAQAVSPDCELDLEPAPPEEEPEPHIPEPVIDETACDAPEPVQPVPQAESTPTPPPPDSQPVEAATPGKPRIPVELLDRTRKQVIVALGQAAGDLP